MKAKKNFIAALVLVGLAPQVAALAADGVPPGKAPSLSDVLSASGDLHASGDLGVTYTKFNTDATGLRAFDNNPSGFTFNQLGLDVTDLPASGAGAAVSMYAGEDGRTLRQAESWPYNKTAAPFDLYTAYGQYSWGKYTIMGGKLPTLAGVESVDLALNSTISRSLLFWDMQPGSHVGLRFSAGLSRGLTLYAGLNNGWNFTNSPAGVGQTAELGVSGAAGRAISYSGTLYTGSSPLFGENSNGRLSLLDGVLNYQVNPRLALTVNLDYLRKASYLGAGSGEANAKGAAVYVSWRQTPKLTLVTRLERIVDAQGIVSGILGVPNTLDEGTLAATYQLTGRVRLAGEYRVDSSGSSVFFEGGGVVGVQRSFELSGTYSF